MQVHCFSVIPRILIWRLTMPVSFKKDHLVILKEAGKVVYYSKRDRVMKFVAIDFETANYAADSACALAFVRVENGRIARKDTYLIRPPSSWFTFTDIHGITWKDVKNEKTFGELWDVMRQHFDNVDFVVAHNASFDKGVLAACCETYGVAMPDVEFKCTVKLSRSVLGIYPTKLPMVCSKLGIELNHHNAASDAEACARIMMEIERRWG